MLIRPLSAGGVLVGSWPKSGLDASGVLVRVPIVLGIEGVETAGYRSRGPVEERPVMALDHPYGRAHHPRQFKDADSGSEGVRRKR